MSEKIIFNKQINNWQEELSLNIDFIDKEHKMFFDVMDSVFAAARTGYKEFETNFQDALSHLVWHFKNEEDYMRSVLIYKPYIDYHKNIHSHCIVQLGKMRDAILKLNSRDEIVYHEDLAVNLAAFLKNWLIFHIIAEDMKISKQISLIEEGYEPEEAFKKLSEDSNKSMDILSTTLTNLIKIYEIRNDRLLEVEADTRASLENKERQLQEQIQENERKSITDELTGIYNRRYAMQTLNHIWSEDNEPTCSIIQMDLDKFKEVNDTFGHHAGNIVLERFTDCVKEYLENDNIASKYSGSIKEMISFCRLGGDEFIIILQKFSLDETVKIALGIHTAINSLEVVDEYRRVIWRGSVSIGVGCRNVNNQDYESVLKSADKYLYKAKEDGRNCVRSMLHELGGGFY